MYYCSVENFYNSISLEEKDGKRVVSMPATGLKAEDISVKFKGDECTVALKESNFNYETAFSWTIGFNPKKDGIKVYTLNGVLFIEVSIPEDYEFEIEVGVE